MTCALNAWAAVHHIILHREPQSWRHQPRMQAVLFSPSLKRLPHQRLPSTVPYQQLAGAERPPAYAHRMLSRPLNEFAAGRPKFVEFGKVIDTEFRQKSSVNR